MEALDRIPTRWGLFRLSHPAAPGSLRRRNPAALDCFLLRHSGMSLALLLPFAVAFAAAQAPDTASQHAALQKGPPPIPVEVVSVDLRGGTITVRELDTIPARSDTPVEVTLTVPSTALGQPLRETRAGQRVAITCESKAPAPPSAPVALTACVRVTGIAATRR